MRHNLTRAPRMHRQPDHVIQFLFAELGTTGSVDGSQRLVIKGRFQPKQLENVLRRYIGAFLDTGYSLYSQMRSRVRNMQNVQVTGHDIDQGEPHLLYVV